ncbi:nuclear transport factor 2 family protein [Roseomonas sp. E05]|uniref:nuclear transport factor 2 family protein n=1 Tax=Roseomonas sp. E05 TaxID=3046310 RepID=UPI0024B8A7B5|nr:nuclear transport factor 2 family protein [Roseomonas sp. E05]MDJ0390949.1 nuclear transport factor 2 family protein [Roseomonas sp. E05]
MVRSLIHSFRTRRGALCLTAALVGGALLPLPAHAGPAGDLAQQRITAIAAGQTQPVLAGYGEGAVLEWIGGPLDGRYTGQAALGQVWSRFAQGQGPLQAQVGSITESANPRGQTVAANVVFTGKATIKVRYVLVYRDGKVVNEIWQVDPNLPG